MIKRSFDFLMALFAFFVLMPLMLIIGLWIRISTHGPALYWSKRIGRHNRIFLMPKFRTMRPDTPQLATHLLEDPEKWVTPLGRMLRSHSLDELPQLWNILMGEMSFVGPRPALFNQDDLIKLRTEKKVDTLTPGLTGWAQINGRDHLSIPEKVQFDREYLEKRSFFFDLWIIYHTFFKVAQKHGIQH